MHMLVSHSLGRSLVVIGAAALFAACGDRTPVAPNRMAPNSAQLDLSPARDHDRDIQHAVATLQRVTARFHNLEVAKHEGFVLLHECEVLPGEGPVGIVYVNMARLTDGVINPELPDALIYEPETHGPPKLVGAELAIPFSLWTQPEPPKFLGATFQREDDVGAFGLHVWVWRENPNGLFAETNPRVSCGA